ncbi:MAG TPA: ABC transporter ATP-binding protein [Thermoleophilia bacterium]|nr:ABC transporter ATP-binding protein [Thermoleophilia bacterium]
MTVILETEALTKRFGALAAVDAVSFAVEEGEVFGIAGPNGAGKTTLFDVISGHAHATGGVVRFKGREIQRIPAFSICHLGMARTYQVASVLTTQTVLGNIILASYFGAERRRFAALNFDDAAIERAERSAEFVGLQDQLRQPGGLLSAYDRKRVMFAAALATDPDLLLLDEPAGGLSEDECLHLMDLIGRVKKQGVTVMIVEHVMSVLMRVSDRVMMMHQGARFFLGTPAEVQQHPDVIRVYLGNLVLDQFGALPEVQDA